ncbi:hypothetical protein BELL_0119g00070 [Botrytis elliptica]|uniref:Uncharacterized protein n=1 Tax=Botrytis elliptica TaxID=278938 RepID=A0A4Z1JZS1_9HELO|nr:hypothetical protein BELL_0119g00070 [Botrytis elliptica]
MIINERNLQMTYNQSVDDRSALDQSFTLLPRLKSFQGYRTENLSLRAALMQSNFRQGPSRITAFGKLEEIVLGRINNNLQAR